MRVTNNMMANTVLRNIGANAANINKIQDQMSSTYRINRLSDDPLGMITSLSARAKKYAMERHVTNLGEATSWLEMVEDSIMDMNKIITTIYTDTIDASTDAKTADDRRAIAQKVREFRDQLVTNANSTINDRYLFGGYNASQAPFEVKYGSLYYNGYNMYSYPTYAADQAAGKGATLNAEQFIATGMKSLFDQVAAMNPASSGDAVSAAKEIQTAMEAVIDAARSVYNSRKVADPDNGNQLVDPSAKHLLGAMKSVIDANDPANGGGWSAEQLAAATSLLDAAQDAQNTHLREFNTSASVDLIMKGLEQCSTEVGSAIREFDKLNNNGEYAGAADALAYLEGKRDEFEKVAQKASDAATAGMGIADEADKKYEIEVGYGQLMNITMNGVEIFGVGENNLYKILDDLYTALTREYTDTSYGSDAYVSEMMDSLRGFLNDPAAVYADLDDYKDQLKLATDAVDSIARLGAGLLQSGKTYNAAFGPEGQMDSAMTFLKDSAYLNGAATIADYSSRLTAIANAYAQVATVGSTQLKSGATPAEVTTAMRAAVDTSLDADVQQALNALIDQVNSAYNSGMQRDVLDVGLSTLSNAVQQIERQIAKEITNVPNPTVGDLQNIVSKRAGEASASLEKAQNTADGTTIDKVIARMTDAIYDSWPSEVKSAIHEMISKLERGKTQGMTLEDLANNLLSVSGSMQKLQADAQSVTTTVADAQKVLDQAQIKALSDYKTSKNGLKSGSRAEDITPFVSKMQAKQKDMMSLQAIIGGRTNRIEILVERYSLDDLNYTTRISKIEDVDMAWAMMQYKMASSVYNSALQAGANVIQPTLMDFLR